MSFYFTNQWLPDFSGWYNSDLIKSLTVSKRRNFGKAINNVILLSLVLFLFALIFESRSFCVGYLTSCWCLLLLKYPFKRKQLIILGAASGMLIFIITVSLFKTDSSLGRLLVYNITCNIWKDHWLNGLGIGKFRACYLYYQAAYFKAGNFTQKELLLADNTQFAFNDYWQLILETGLKGIAFILSGFSMLFYLIVKSLKNDHLRSFLLLFAIVHIIVISVAALYMHVFEHFIIQCGYIACIFVIASFAYPGVVKQLAGSGVVCLMMTSYLNWALYLTNYSNYQKLADAQILYRAGYIEQSLCAYRQLFHSLKDDSLYLWQYAAVLTSNDCALEADEVLRLNLDKLCDNRHYSLLAELYYKRGRMKEAEQAYLLSIYMVPNRFQTRYDLFMFYCLTQQKAKAIATGRAIMALPVKIPSGQVSRIQHEVIEKLETLN
jgi:hypothetical protein